MPKVTQDIFLIAQENRFGKAQAIEVISSRLTLHKKRAYWEGYARL